MYLGLSAHAKTRSRKLVDNLYDLGLSVSYDRVMSISTNLGNGVCRRFEEEQVVCPTNLRKGLFTTAAIDNIDHNPSSTTASDSFHGTGISLFQHVSTNCPGIDLQIVAIEQSLPTITTKKISQLPDSYANVPPASFCHKDSPIPEMQCKMQGDGSTYVCAVIEEFLWLETVRAAIDRQQNLEDGQCILWAGYHSNAEKEQELPINLRMPLRSKFNGIGLKAMVSNTLLSCLEGCTLRWRLYDYLDDGLKTAVGHQPSPSLKLFRVGTHKYPSNSNDGRSEAYL